MPPLADQLQSHLRHLRILPRELVFDWPCSPPTLSMLRGLWGAALHDTCVHAYRDVFKPSQGQTPGYVFQHCPDASQSTVRWVLVQDAINHDQALCEAWQSACRRGVGPEHKSFKLKSTCTIGPDAQPSVFANTWTLDHASPGELQAVDQPCWLVFPRGLSIRRVSPGAARSSLIEQPTLADVVVAACRRVGMLLPRNRQATWRGLSRKAVELAKQTPASPWSGRRRHVQRYSARQQRHFQQHAVIGQMHLPNGPGELAALLSAAAWLQIGKAASIGMGAVRIRRSPPTNLQAHRESLAKDGHGEH